MVSAGSEEKRNTVLDLARRLIGEHKEEEWVSRGFSEYLDNNEGQ